MVRVVDRTRPSWVRLEHLGDTNSERHFRLSLEPTSTTSELADYLGVHVQATCDMRTDGRGRPKFIHLADVWLDDPDRSLVHAGWRA
ncbi:hypothetical protein ACFPER_16650 [Agromyces aurantiacus]|uniref:DNA-binding protein n=1 Tax=Agromyces aurantiacus TaxID=165814 RepID=A0ABV9RAX7_9MICO|nr:hypothetical protein [Agromyces aurantiacus]MBM7504678.1 hypothetical protein [Agromyces aurantiacus]